jgi:hypothetical protein
VIYGCNVDGPVTAYDVAFLVVVAIVMVVRDARSKRSQR